jgi:hypothetical protein
MKVTRDHLKKIIAESIDEMGAVQEARGPKVFTVTKGAVLMGVYMDKAAALQAGKTAGAVVKSAPTGVELRQVGLGSGDVIYTPERY